MTSYTMLFKTNGWDGYVTTKLHEKCSGSMLKIFCISYINKILCGMSNWSVSTL